MMNRIPGRIQGDTRAAAHFMSTKKNPINITVDQPNTVAFKSHQISSILSIYNDTKVMEDRQVKRIQHKQTVCIEVYQTKPASPLTKESLQIDKGANFDATFYNEQFQFFVSTSWKVGSTNWLNAMRRLHTKTTPIFNHADDVIPIFGKLNADEFDARIEHFYKVIFVRNPLARLVSAYRDKLVENKNRVVYRDLVKKIVKLFRQGATVEEIEAGNVTFAEFIRYVVDTYPNSDRHWYPVMDHIKPCLIPYDFIGKVETIGADTEYLFQKLKVDQLISFGASYSHGKSGQIDLITYYGTLRDDLFESVMKIYEADFKVFGYRVPDNKTDFKTDEDLIGVLNCSEVGPSFGEEAS